MKALEILKAITENEGTHLWLDDGSGYPKSYIYEAIKELEDLEQENQDLLNSNNEMIECLISTQKRLDDWLKKCN